MGWCIKFPGQKAAVRARTLLETGKRRSSFSIARHGKAWRWNWGANQTCLSTNLPPYHAGPSDINPRNGRFARNRGGGNVTVLTHPQFRTRPLLNSNEDEMGKGWYGPKGIGCAAKRQQGPGMALGVNSKSTHSPPSRCGYVQKGLFV